MLTAREYHDLTSYDRRRMDPHGLDWAGQPGVYKAYPGAAALPLPMVDDDCDESLWAVIDGQVRPDAPAAGPLGLQQVARILARTCTLTARRRFSGGTFDYRSVASAGALYPTELYLAASAVESLAAGVYHFGLERRCLTPLRVGPVAAAVAAATGVESGSRPALSFFVSGIFFRSAWKYRQRALRYVLLDAGHLLENLLLALKACGLSGHLSYDFDDRQVAGLLGLDLEREAPLAVVVVAAPAAAPAPDEEAPAPLAVKLPAAGQVAAREVAYDLIGRAYRSGNGVYPAGAADSKQVLELGVQTTQTDGIPAVSAGEGEMSLSQALRQRRSRRNFAAERLARQPFERLLDLVCRAAALDRPSDPRYRSGVASGVLVSGVEGYPPGFYLLSPDDRRLARVSSGELTTAMAAACLDQMWLAAAAVHFLFMVNLSALDACWGARGYRYAMLGAGRIGQRLYLGATALGLGCCGIGALYDDEARRLLGLSADAGLLYLVAVGAVKGR
ncbi:MAG: SagB/ThcOx family dehydrogenase [Desulfobacterales bacterium]|nr:SagB/ThcOx family dehydrogenase [Desulfobacterales bacterium]